MEQFKTRIVPGVDETTLIKANFLKEICFNNKPVCILLKTIMGNGVDFMMHTHEWHGKAPNDDQLMIGLNQNEETLGDY